MKRKPKVDVLDIIAVIVLILDIMYSVKAYMDHAYIYLTGDIICALALIIVFGSKAIMYIRNRNNSKSL